MVLSPELKYFVQQVKAQKHSLLHTLFSSSVIPTKMDSKSEARIQNLQMKPM